jgi:hypothetical protein
MAIKKNLKDQSEEIWKPLISDELAFRIMNLAVQTGVSPPDIILKWVLQEEAWIGLMQSGKSQTAKQPKTTAVDNPVQKVKSAKMLKKEGMTHNKIAETFNGEKIPTVSGTGKWYASSINNLLKK